ncbi:EamA family transporter RarD [Novosphingobium sp.]|uniref:EamA family transporter RarD n=1 Tax=Novosphingobium sp. TaxID=1874826 RepID=UPI0038B8CD7F
MTTRIRFSCLALCKHPARAAVMDHAAKTRTGLAAALLTYLIWGFLPLYFRELHHVPSVELVAWRIIFTLPLCLLFLFARGQWHELGAALRTPRLMVQLSLSAVLVAMNWLIYIFAINAGHVLAASLGYFINPLVNVLLGTLVLKETLNRLQWSAVGIAAFGIALLLGGPLDMMVVALSLATSFGLYGLVRKLAPVGAVTGQAIESLVLYVPAVLAALWFATQGQGSSILDGPGTAALLFGAGVLTAVPLALFAMAARSLDLSTLGFIQFLSPTIVFVLGLAVYHEPLDSVRLACFVLIWIAIGVFSADMVLRARGTKG